MPVTRFDGCRLDLKFALRWSAFGPVEQRVNQPSLSFTMNMNSAGPMILSVHIPKTAGVSIRNFLKEHYDAGFVLSYWQVTDAFGRVLPEVPSSAACVHGHFVADHLADRFPDATLVTWVREPVDRVVSSYYHRLRDPDWQNSVCRKVHEEKLGLVEFAELPEMRNEMAHFMGRKQPADFDFIGIMEDFDFSLEIFCEQFGLPAKPARLDNCNPWHPVGQPYELPAAIRATIFQLNEVDAEIYAECLDLAKRDHYRQPVQLSG